MAYKNIDRQRLSYLLSLGTSDFELRTFFRECRLQLIQSGAKVQNLPASPAARVRAISSEIPASTDGIVRAWFAKNVTMVDPAPAEQLIELYRRYEVNEDAEPEPEESAKRYARASLVHLFSEEPLAAFIDFLRTPIGGNEREAPEASQPEASPLSESQFPVPPNLGHAIIGLAEGSEVDPHLEGLPGDLAAFISGVQSIAKGQQKEAQEALDSLPQSQLRDVLADYLRRDAAKRALGETGIRGLTFAETPRFEGEFECERDEILGYCTKADQPKAIFVHPLGAVQAGRVSLLDDQDRKRLFPETGDVISFFGPGHPRQPVRGELGIWRVSPHATDKATRFHLNSEKRPVYEVFEIPFASTDYDSVRQYLLDVAGKKAKASLQPILFQLSDGLIVGPRGEWGDLARAEVLEAGLSAWTSLAAIRVEGRIVVLGPLPRERTTYECGTIGYVLRKLTRNVAGKLPGGITRAQIRDLAQFLDSTDQVVDVLRIQRLKSQLADLDATQEALDELIASIQNRPEVQNRIDAVVATEVQKRVARRAELHVEIERLQKERDEWDGRVRKQQSEHKRLREETVNLVRAAFQKAKDESVATLADVAIFQALSGLTSSMPMQQEPMRAVLPEAVVRDIPPNPTGSPAEILRSLGIGRQKAAAIAALGKIAIEQGLILGIRGVAARYATEQWCGFLGGGTVIDATVGMIDPTLVSDSLTHVPALPSIGIIDANLSAIDIYGKSLLDLVIKRLSSPDQGTSPSLLIGLSSGVGSLPYPEVFSKVSVVMNLDAKHTLRPLQDLEELESIATDHEDGALYATLWRNAADRLKIALDQLEPETRVTVLSLLVTADSAG